MTTEHSQKPLVPKSRVLVLGLVLSLLVVVGASLVVYALPGRSSPVAHASGGGGGIGCCGTMTINNAASLLVHTTVQLSGTFSCSLQPPGSTVQFAQVQVTLTQASGKTIVQAFGFISVTTTCDGTATPYQVSLTPSSGSAKFKGGKAIASGTFSVGYFASSYYDFLILNVAVNNQVISIKG